MSFAESLLTDDSEEAELGESGLELSWVGEFSILVSIKCCSIRFDAINAYKTKWIRLLFL